MNLFDDVTKEAGKIVKRLDVQYQKIELISVMRIFERYSDKRLSDLNLLSVILRGNGGYGSSWTFNYRHDPLLLSLVGETLKNAILKARKDKALLIALCDAAFNFSMKPKPIRQYHYQINMNHYQQRAEIVLKELNLRTSDFFLCIGYFEDIVDRALHVVQQVDVVEKNKALTSIRSRRLRFYDLSLLKKLIHNYDVVLISGMALLDGTLEEVLKLTLNGQPRVLVLAQTGSNFAYKYKEYGAWKVVADKPPFVSFLAEVRNGISVY